MPVCINFGMTLVKNYNQQFKMATGGRSGEITNRQYVELGRAISRPNMESIALGYLNIDQETIDSLKVQHRENTEAFNREIIRIWAYKNSESDQAKVRDYPIPFFPLACV